MKYTTNLIKGKVYLSSNNCYLKWNSDNNIESRNTKYIYDQYIKTCTWDNGVRYSEVPTYIAEWFNVCIRLNNVVPIPNKLKLNYEIYY